MPNKVIRLEGSCTHVEPGRGPATTPGALVRVVSHASTGTSDLGAEPPQTMRGLFVQAGLEILERDGLALGADSISYAKVFAHLESNYAIKVTRASVHERIWPNHDAFRAAVLAEAVGHFEETGQGSFRDDKTWAARLQLEPDSTAENDVRIDRWARSFGEGLVSQSAASQSFRQMQLAKIIAIQSHDPFTVTTLRERLNLRRQETIGRRRERLPIGLAVMGLAPQPDFGFDLEQSGNLLTVISASLMVGGSLNQSAGMPPLDDHVQVQTSAADGPQDWQLGALAFRALTDLLFSPGPDQAEPLSGPLPEPSPLRRPPEVVPEGEPARTGRRARHELERIVIAAGVELLLEEGLNLKSESLSYGAVIAHVRERHGIAVFRSSVHGRVWNSPEDYRLEVLSTAMGIASDLPPVVPRPFEVAPPPADLSTDDKRWQAAFDLLRNLTSVQPLAAMDSPEYVRRLTVKAALLAYEDSAAADGLRAKMYARELERAERYRMLYRTHLLSALGFEPRPERALDLDTALTIFEFLGSSTVTGLVFDRLAGIEGTDELFAVPRLGAADSPDEWTVGGLALRFYFTYLFQPIS